MGRPPLGTPYIGTRGGRYYAFWYDPATRRTRRRSLRAAAPGEAERNFALFLFDRQRDVQPERRLPVTVEAALDAYLREHVAQKCADAARQEDAANNLKAFFKAVLLAEVDIPLSRAYADARRAGRIGGGRRRRNKKGSDSTIRRELVVLVAAANHARKWKRVTAAEMPSVELPPDRPAFNGQSFDREAKFFSRRQIAEILFNAPGDDRIIAKLAYFYGARRRTIENLFAEQVRLEDGQLSLATPGKPFTQKRQPLLPILDEVRGDLERLLCLHPSGRLFATRSFHRNFTTLCKRLGFPAPFNPHMLRHSRATHLLQDGVDLYDVAKLLGDDIRTVSKTYGHHSPSALKAALSGKPRAD